jgi:hypothetical protein
MGTTPPDDVAAMFDLPPLPAPAPSGASALEAEEAALAAELAATLESTGVADDAPDSRRLGRVEVSWPARMRLPDGQVIELRVRNVSESGVGLASGAPMPPCTVVGLEVDVPALDAGGVITPIKGTAETTYMVTQGAQVLGGAQWQQRPADLEAVIRWIAVLRR